MKGLATELAKPADEDRVLRLILEGTVSETGEAFFRALVRNLSEALGTPYAWVTEWQPAERRLRSLAFWCEDHYVDDYAYRIDGTPCQAVVDKACLAHFPDRIVELFPGDSDLPKLEAVSYLGAPLFDADGALLGHLAVMDKRPMPAQARLIAVFQIFATRAAAEYRRVRMEAELQSQREQLALFVDSAMDAILVLDTDLRIVRVNPAALRAFGCGQDDLVGENITDFLTEGAAKVLPALLREAIERSLWLPASLEAVRWNRQRFSIEGTLSSYRFHGETFYALLVRDTNERLEWERRIRALTAETEYLREVVGEAPGEMGIVGRSAGVRAVCNAIRQVAPTDATVLILGETGTGKELVARAIHEGSARRSGPLVRVNCAAIPESLIESEFFGHEKGAFTGAVARREGRFAQANQGTIFLDEVGELPLELQAKLLRVLQEGEFEPLGGTRTFKVNVRVVAATNRDLERAIGEGRFREDLYYRLNVFPIRLPPLRERENDILLLAETFANRFAQRMGRRVERLDENDRILLKSYSWPGNVRELQNVIERALILSVGHRLDLVRAMPRGGVTLAIDEPAAMSREAISRVLSAAELEELERRNILRALDARAWKIAGPHGAAALLGMPPSTLSSRIKALRIVRGSAGC